MCLAKLGKLSGKEGARLFFDLFFGRISGDRGIRSIKSPISLAVGKLVAQARFYPAVKRSANDSSPPILIINLYSLSRIRD